VSRFEFNTVLESLLILLPTLVIALVCFIWVPEIDGETTLDVEQHDFEAGRWAHPLLSLFVLLGAAADLLVPNVAFGPPPLGVLAFAVLLLGLRFSRRRAVHAGVWAISWIVYVGTMIGVQE